MKETIENKLLKEIELLKQKITDLEECAREKNKHKNSLEENEQLKLILQGANIGWCDWDIKNGKEIYNEILPKLLGYKQSEMKNTSRWWEGIIHPDDIDHVKNDMLNHFDGETEFYTNHHRIKTKSGEWKWFFEHGKVIERDKAGRASRMIVTLSDVDKQYKARDAIKTSENKFKTIFENAPILIDSFDKDGRCVLWNKECERVFGWTIDEINSTQNTLALFYHDTDEYDRVYESIIKKSDGKFREWHPYTKSGERLTTTWANFEIAEGLIINIGYNITVQKRLEFEREESEKRFKALAEATYEAIFISDKGVCINTNAAATRMFGYTYDEIIGMLRTDFIADENKNTITKKMLSNSTEPFEAVAKRKDGSRFYAEFQGHRYEHNGTMHSITAVRDISERKKSEKEIIIAKEKAQESDKLKSAFLQNLSHEIRTPLNGILGFTDLIKLSGLSSEDLEEYIDIIERSGTRLLNTINDLMDISMLTSGQISVSVTEVNLSQLISGLFTKFEKTAQLKGVQFSYSNTKFPKDIIVQTDGQKIRTIMIKLISNAIKFTKHGSVEFGFKISGRGKSCQIEFYVKDDGIGIPSNRLYIIFDRFTQVDYSETRNFEGSGLGLSIIKEYAEMLNGKIWVESQVGVGSQFYCMIPCVVKT